MGLFGIAATIIAGMALGWYIKGKLSKKSGKGRSNIDDEE